MKLVVYLLLFSSVLTTYAQHRPRYSTGYPTATPAQAPVWTRPVPDYAKDAQWLRLSTNLARLDTLYASNVHKLTLLRAITTPKPEETRQIKGLDTLTAIQDLQAGIWRHDRADIEARYTLKRKK